MTFFNILGSLSFFVIHCFFLHTVWAKNPEQGLIQRLSSPLVAAHRGGFFGKSNNTIEQFEKGIQDGVDILEMDLRLTKDGVVVVFHDEELSGHSSCKGLIRDLDSSYVLNCTYKSTGHKIPRFEDVLKAVHGRSIINGEFKELEVVAPVISLVQKYSAHNWSYFQANSDREKYHLARSLDAQVGLLLKVMNDEDLDFISSLNDPFLVVVHFNKEDLTAQRIQRVHSLGKLVSVNSWKYDLLEERFRSTCKKMYSLGVDIPVTNNNKDCVKVRDRM